MRSCLPPILPSLVGVCWDLCKQVLRTGRASATNVWLPHIARYVPALESINVVTNTFDAEQGLAGWGDRK